MKEIIKDAEAGSSRENNREHSVVCCMRNTGTDDPFKCYPGCPAWSIQDSSEHLTGGPNNSSEQIAGATCLPGGSRDAQERCNRGLNEDEKARPAELSKSDEQAADRWYAEWFDSDDHKIEPCGEIMDWSKEHGEPWRRAFIQGARWARKTTRNAQQDSLAPQDKAGIRPEDCEQRGEAGEGRGALANDSLTLKRAEKQDGPSLTATTVEQFTQLLRILRDVISRTLAKADDYADSGISRELRDLKYTLSAEHKALLWPEKESRADSCSSAIGGEHDWDAGGEGRHCLKCGKTEPVCAAGVDSPGPLDHEKFIIYPKEEESRTVSLECECRACCGATRPMGCVCDNTDANTIADLKAELAALKARSGEKDGA